MATKKIIAKNENETVIAPGTTGKALEAEKRNPAEEVRMLKEQAKIKKDEEKAAKDAEKLAAKAIVDAQKAEIKAEKEAAKGDVDAAKAIVAEEKKKIADEKAAAAAIVAEEKKKLAEQKAIEKAEAKAAKDAEKLAKAEAKLNAAPSGAAIIRNDYEAKKATFEAVEENAGKKFEYDMAAGAKELGIAYGRVYGCIAKHIENKMIEAAIAKRRAEKEAAAATA